MRAAKNRNMWKSLEEAYVKRRGEGVADLVNIQYNMC